MQTRKIECVRLSTDFRDATRITRTGPSPTHTQLKPTQILVQTLYVGINASDINFTAGKYTPGISPPFDCGFELVGRIVAVGARVPQQSHPIGSAVGVTGYGAFAEYRIVKYKAAVPLPDCRPEFLPLLVSGLTASLALEHVGELNKHKTKEVVLVTAAAGGTGQFAVQLAKLKGNHVIGTCSTSAKAAMLKSLGCDRVVNYKKESLMSVLKNEYPKGVDVVYESVGGEFFQTCLKNLAVHGRLIVIGFIAGYKSGKGFASGSNSGGGSISLPARLLATSASVRGFFLNNFSQHFRRHMDMLTELVLRGDLKCVVDSPPQFIGLESVADAIDYMYAGKNIGKLVVPLHSAVSQQSML